MLHRQFAHWGSGSDGTGLARAQVGAEVLSLSAMAPFLVIEWCTLSAYSGAYSGPGSVFTDLSAQYERLNCTAQAAH